MFAPALANTVSGFDPAVFDELTQMEAGHFWFSARNRLLVGLADKFFPQARRFLEVGCGTGEILVQLSTLNPAATFIGYDISPQALELAAQSL